MANESRSDLELIYTRVLTAEGPALGRLAASYARRAADCDDLLQDIALAFWRALPGFRGECTERTFLFRIAHNRGIRYLSRHRRLAALEENQAALGQMEAEDPQPGGEAMVAEQQDREWLVRAIRSLPLIYREVLILALEGMGYAEIAEVLGLSARHVGVRLNRARQLLRGKLENWRTRSE